MDITNNDRKPEQISGACPNNNFPTKCNCPYMYNYDNRSNGDAGSSSPELDNYRPTPGGGYQGHGGNYEHSGNYGHGGNYEHGGSYEHGGYYDNDNYGNFIFPLYYQYPYYQYPYYGNDYYSSYQY